MKFIFSIFVIILVVCLSGCADIPSTFWGKDKILFWIDRLDDPEFGETSKRELKKYGASVFPFLLNSLKSAKDQDRRAIIDFMRENRGEYLHQIIELYHKGNPDRQFLSVTLLNPPIPFNKYSDTVLNMALKHIARAQ